MLIGEEMLSVKTGSGCVWENISLEAFIKSELFFLGHSGES